MPLLELDEITVKFGGLTALDGVSFGVEDGSSTALIGPNGAGKTTCFNVISGFQRPNAGRVSFDGADLTNVPAHRRTGVGRTFQRIALVAHMTVRENVMLGLHTQAVGSFVKTGLWVPKVRASERTVLAETNRLLDEYGLVELAEREARTLPLGFQRLVEIARAQAQRPRLLLLDEAASGLDLAELDLLVERIARLRAVTGCALLIVEHDMRFVLRVAEHLVALHYGRTMFDGPVAAGMQDEAVRAAYLGRGRTSFA